MVCRIVQYQFFPGDWAGTCLCYCSHQEKSPPLVGSVESRPVLLDFILPLPHTYTGSTHHHRTPLPPPPQSYILHSLMSDSSPPPHVLNLVSHLLVFKITAREIPASAAGCCRVRLFFGFLWRRQRTHGKTSPWKWSIVHLCVSVLPPLPSCFYTYVVLHPRPSPSLPPPPPPPPPSSSPLHIKEEKHMNTVDVSFRCGANLTERWSYLRVVVSNIPLLFFTLHNIT